MARARFQSRKLARWTLGWDPTRLRPRLARRKSGEIGRLNGFMPRDVGPEAAHIDRPDRLIEEARERLRGPW